MNRKHAGPLVILAATALLLAGCPEENDPGGNGFDSAEPRSDEEQYEERYPERDMTPDAPEADPEWTTPEGTEGN